MAAISVLIGSIATYGQRSIVETQAVEFEGEKLAVYRPCGGNEVQTLYRARSDHLVVHVESTSRGVTTYDLRVVSLRVLRKRYPQLARCAGLDRPLSLNEALDA
jgi:hypothetical protein